MLPEVATSPCRRDRGNQPGAEARVTRAPFAQKNLGFINMKFYFTPNKRAIMTFNLSEYDVFIASFLRHNHIVPYYVKT